VELILNFIMRQFTLPYYCVLLYMSRDGSVGIALGYWLDDRGSKVPFLAGAGNFSLHHRVQNGSGAQWLPGALSLGINVPGREADHSPPSSAEVKNEWSYTSTPQHSFMTWCLFKHRNNFIFMLLCIILKSR
jgi:hypothetical protein